MVTTRKIKKEAQFIEFIKLVKTLYIIKTSYKYIVFSILFLYSLYSFLFFSINTISYKLIYYTKFII